MAERPRLPIGPNGIQPIQSRQSIRTTPQAFGGDTGLAELGQALATAGAAANAMQQQAEQRRKKLDTIAAQRAMIEYDRAESDMLYNPTNGLMHRKGAAAANVSSEYVNASSELYKKYADGLSEDAKLLFELNITGQQTNRLSGLRKKEENEIYFFAKESNSVILSGVLNEASMVNKEMLNEKWVEDNANKAFNAISSSAALDGLPTQSVDIAMDKFRKQFYSTMAQSMIDDGESRGFTIGDIKSFIETHQDDIDGSSKLLSDIGKAVKVLDIGNKTNNFLDSIRTNDKFGLIPEDKALEKLNSMYGNDLDYKNIRERISDAYSTRRRAVNDSNNAKSTLYITKFADAGDNRVKQQAVIDEVTKKDPDLLPSFLNQTANIVDNERRLSDAYMNLLAGTITEDEFMQTPGITIQTKIRMQKLYQDTIVPQEKKDQLKYILDDINKSLKGNEKIFELNTGDYQLLSDSVRMTPELAGKFRSLFTKMATDPNISSDQLWDMYNKFDGTVELRAATAKEAIINLIGYNTGNKVTVSNLSSRIQEQAESSISEISETISEMRKQLDAIKAEQEKRKKQGK